MAENRQTPPKTSVLADAWLKARIWSGRQRLLHPPQTGKPIRALIMAEILAAILLSNLVANVQPLRTSSPFLTQITNPFLRPIPGILNTTTLEQSMMGSGLPATDPAPAYAAVDLGTLGGQQSNVLGPPFVSQNDSGEIVGSSLTPSGTTEHAFLWTATSGMVDLGTLGDPSSFASGINNFGEVIGDDVDQFNSAHPFLWVPSTAHSSSGHLTALNPPPGHSFCSPLAINSSGAVALTCTLANNLADILLFEPSPPNSATGSYLDLGNPFGATVVANISINDHAEITGIGSLGQPGTSAFIVSPTFGPVDLGTLPGSSGNVPYSINDFGQVAGISFVNPSSERPFLWTPTSRNGAVGSIHDLGTLGGSLSAAFNLNASGAVAGDSQVTAGSTHAVVWFPSVSNGTTGTLTDLEPGTIPNSLAMSINDAGFLAGQALSNGGTGAVAAIWNPSGQETILGNPTGFSGSGGAWINAQGQVAGDGVTSGVFHAVAWIPSSIGPPPPSGQQPPTGGVLGANQMAGGHNPSNPNSGQTIGCAGQPINTENGSLWHTCTDFSIPGRGLPLNLTRTYNSVFANQDSPVGFGWTCSYCMTLHEDTVSGDVTISQENGSQVIFHRSGATYTASPWVIATLAKNTDGSWTFVREAQATFVFDPSGRLSSERDLNGYQTNLSYNSGQQLVSITDPAGRSLALTYSGSHIAKITDPIGRTVQLNYDAFGNLSSYVDVQGNTTQFSYDQNHLMSSMTDPKGGVTSNVFDGQNRVTSQTDPMGRKTVLAYSGDPLTSTGGTTIITDPKGNITQEQYQNGFRVSLTKGFGTAQAATWKFEYDTTALGITKATDPNGNATKNTFDQSGNLLTTTDPLNRQTANSYNALNELLTTKDGNGITTTFSYDPHGNLLSVSRPLVQSAQVQTTSFRYQDASHPGDVTSKTDPNGNIWKYSYDKFGNQTSVSDPIGNKSSATFNKVGFKLSSTSPKGNLPDQDQHHRGDSNHDDNSDVDGSKDSGSFTTTFKYNNYGDLLNSTDPLGHKQSTQYDANRNVVQSTDGNGNVTKNVFDADNELVQVNRADGTAVKTTYNPDGTVLAQIDGNGAATTYQYDSLARTTSSADPLGRATHYSYDGAGNLLTKTDAKSQITTYKYDSANQVTGITYSDGVTPNVTNLQYDNNGNRLFMTDGTGTSSYNFDSLNRLTQSKDGAGALVGYGYDLNGNLTQLTYPPGNKVTRGFDADSRIASVSDWLGNTESFAYDANSNLVTTTFPGSTKEVDQQAFDNADNLISIVDTKNNSNNDGSHHGNNDKQPALASFYYTRDGNNQVTSESPKPSADNGHGDQNIQGDDSASKSKTYTYTPLNQLKNVNRASYSYDPADNLVHLINGTTQTFDAANQLVNSVSPGNQADQKGQHQGHQPADPSVTTTYAYDLNGNRTSQTAGGVPTNFSFDQANRLTNFNGVASYSYNGDGLRMSKKVGSTVQPMTWDVAEGLPLLLSDPRNQFVYGPGGLPLEQVSSSGTVDFFHHDQLGSTRLLTSSKGQMDGAFTFDPYGNLSNSSGSAASPLMFAGEYLDGESALYYLRARYYQATTGQFLVEDPLASTTGSAFAYAMGNPLSWRDPAGLFGVSNLANAWRVAQGVFGPCSSLGSLLSGAGRFLSIAASRGAQGPDYLSFDVSGGSVLQGGGTLTYTRYGQIFIAPGGGAGIPGVTASLRAGWIDSSSMPSRSYLANFVAGPSLTVAGFLPVAGAPEWDLGVGLSAGQTWGNEGLFGWQNFSTELGIAVGLGKNISAMQTFSFQLPITGPGW